MCLVRYQDVTSKVDRFVLMLRSVNYSNYLVCFRNSLNLAFLITLSISTRFEISL